MLDLPGNRLIPDKPPFSNVGIDFFCPLYVEQDSWKLWCLLSCLIIRAIHIKVTESFETDSFISGLCIFTRKRETPKKIRSDNGMNSSGREREIREASNNWNKQKIEVFLHQKNIKWKFNFSGASHVGGVWERMIRSVRKILRVGSGKALRTLMAAVEEILNGRPLTPNSGSPVDSESLTSNHLLLWSHLN